MLHFYFPVFEDKIYIFAQLYIYIIQIHVYIIHNTQSQTYTFYCIRIIVHSNIRCFFLLKKTTKHRRHLVYLSIHYVWRLYIYVRYLDNQMIYKFWQRMQTKARKICWTFLGYAWNFFFFLFGKSFVFFFFTLLYYYSVNIHMHIIHIQIGMFKLKPTLYFCLECWGKKNGFYK